MLRIAFSRHAIRALRRMPVNEARRIRAKIEAYARNPAAQANNVARLRGRDGYRLRVGDWRVIFERDETTLAILDIGPRGGIYR
jgi:mRNA interferase RelE/StbE